MSKKIDRTFPILCCKCGKPVGKNLLIPARANRRTVKEAFRVITSSLCEVCKNSSISVITDPVTGLNFEVQSFNLRHNSEQKPVKWEKTYEGL